MKKQIFIAMLMILPLTLHAQTMSPEHASRFAKGNIWTTQDGTEYFTCPVMHGELKVENCEATSVIDGITFYHCCPPCQGPFRSDPDRWLSDLALPANITTVDSEGRKHFTDPINGKSGIVGKKTLYLDVDNQRWFFTLKKSAKQFEKKNAE